MSSPDKNQYSLEDMVRSAKTTEQNKKRRGEREVVYNDDGTKTIKVRKRKKSSKQSSSKESVDDLLGSSNDSNTTKSILIVSIICFLFVFVLGGYGFLNLLKFNTPTHYQKVKDAVTKQFGSDVEIENMKFKVNKFTAEELKTEGSDSFFSDFKLSKLKAEYNPSSVLYSDINSDQLRAQSGSARVNEVSSIKKNRLVSPLPIKFKSFALDNFDIDFQNNQNTTLLDSVFRYKVSSNKAKQVSIRNGEIKNLLALPAYLKRSSFNIKGGLVEVSVLLGSESAVGECKIDGEMDLAFQEKHDLELSMKSLNLEELYAPVTNVFEGRVSSRSGKFTLFPQTKEYEYESSLSAISSGISIKRFQFLDQIGLYLEDVDYSYIIFRDNTEFNLSYKEGTISLNEIDFEKKSYLAITGDLKIDSTNQKLHGTLKVGIPTGKVLRVIGDLNVDNFEVRRGYLWIDVNVRGNLEAPIDDFKEQFERLR